MSLDSQVFKQAERSFNRGNFADCLELLLIYMKENASDFEARLLMAKSFLEMKQFQSALTQIEAIRQLSQISRKPCAEADKLYEDVSQAVAELKAEGNGAEHAEPDQGGEPAAEEEDPLDSIRASRGISPYFGFPEKANVAGHTNNYGFIYSKHRGLIDCPYTPKDNEYIVGIFGGSVASGFFQDCAEYIEQNLAVHPDLAGKDIVLLNFATGAVKQPQQLFYLNYFVAIGQKFNLVINLDGINDMAGAISNITSGHHPAMPAATLTNSFEGLTSVPDLNPVSLNYFLELSKAEKRLKSMTNGLKSSLTPKFRVKQMQRNVDNLRNRLPEGMVSKPLLEIHRIEPKDFYSSDAVGRKELSDATIQLWERCTRMMMATCQWLGVKYIHAIQPNHYYCKKVLVGEDAKLMAKGFSNHFDAMVNETWPRIIEIARGLDTQYPVYCHMTDVMDEVTDDVFRDAVCHFNAAGHTAMADRLCGFLHEQSLN